MFQIRQDRASHFRYFFIFSIIKNDFFVFFIKLITYLWTSPILKAHSQSNYLDKKCQKSIFVKEKIKKYLKCPALRRDHADGRGGRPVLPAQDRRPPPRRVHGRLLCLRHQGGRHLHQGRLRRKRSATTATRLLLAWPPRLLRLRSTAVGILSVLVRAWHLRYF